MKKKILSFVLAICLIIPCCVVLASCSNKQQNYNKLSVKDWNSYSQICAGYVSKSLDSGNEAISNKTVVYADSNSDKTPKLIGLKDDGSYQPITFIDDNNSDVKQNLYLCGFQTFSNFTFLRYDTTCPTKISNYYNNCSGDGYALSNKTGKIYKLEYDINIYTSGVWDESLDAVFALNQQDKKIVKLYEQNEQLVIKEIFNMSSLTGFGSTYFVDKYGNIFSGNKKYIIKTNNRMELLSESGLDLYKGINGIVYCENKCFDNSGELVDASFVPSNRYNFTIGSQCCRQRNNNLLKSSANTYYYYENGDAYYETNGTNFVGDRIFKVIFTSEVEYSIKEILLEDYEHTSDNPDISVFANDKLYFISSNEVYYLNIESGAKTTINSSYLFNKIWSDNKGNVCFSAIDSSLNSISGIIKSDDTTDITTTTTNFDIKYILPLNWQFCKLFKTSNV